MSTTDSTPSTNIDLSFFDTALEHMFTTVWYQTKDGQIRSALERSKVYNIDLLLSFTYDEIKGLRFINAKGHHQQLSTGDYKQLNNFRDYVRHMEAKGTPIENFLDITFDDVARYSRSLYCPFDRSNYVATGGTTGGASTPPIPMPTPTPRTRSAKDEFMKGIKRDITIFPTLKNEEFWDQWNCQLKATAHMQDVAEVLSGSYYPSTADAKELFKAKQEFMYTVFECTILTSQGKDIVCQHELTFDAQKI